MTSFDQRQQDVERQYNAGQDVNIAGRDLHVYRQAAPTVSASDRQGRENRRRLLMRVRGEVEGWRRGSLEGAARLALGLEDRSEAVLDRWGEIIQERGRATSEPVSPRAIAEVFDRA